MAPGGPAVIIRVEAARQGRLLAGAAGEDACPGNRPGFRNRRHGLSDPGELAGLSLVTEGPHGDDLAGPDR